MPYFPSPPSCQYTTSLLSIQIKMADTSTNLPDDVKIEDAEEEREEDPPYDEMLKNYQTMLNDFAKTGSSSNSTRSTLPPTAAAATTSSEPPAVAATPPSPNGEQEKKADPPLGVGPDAIKVDIDPVESDLVYFIFKLTDKAYHLICGAMLEGLYDGIKSDRFKKTYPRPNYIISQTQDTLSLMMANSNKSSALADLAEKSGLKEEIRAKDYVDMTKKINDARDDPNIWGTDKLNKVFSRK